jgi:formiminoglutamase
MNFYKYDKTKVDELTSVREGECKIGQMIKSYDDFDDFSGGFVIIGVSESVGPQANLGFKGSENGFNSFVSRFLNVQSNRFFVGDTLLLYGEIQVLTSENKSIS